jgi:hypothetical protein
MANDSRTNQVSLGCGTLILIALIVLIFSGRGKGDVEAEVRGLRNEVQDLKRAVDAQTQQLSAIRARLEVQKPERETGINDK